jgi:hypothetical protein
MQDCKSKIDRSNKRNRKIWSCNDAISNSPEIKHDLETIQQDLGSVSTDKTSIILYLFVTKKTLQRTIFEGTR